MQGGRMAMPDFLASDGEHRELVGVAHVERHGRGQELLAVVGLQIGGVVAHERIGGRVALVEAVAGELVDQLEDVVGVRLLDAVLAWRRRTKRLCCCAISRLSFLPMARRSRSASPSEKPAITWAICITCSW